MLRLVIGNKNYSSWSLRAWLYLTESGIPFEEHRIALFTDAWRKEIASYRAAGKVPLLIDGETVIWDSLAIIEHVCEHWSEAARWPDSRVARAVARSVSCEMHSGFTAIRTEMPQNLRRPAGKPAAPPSEACLKEIQRVDELWTRCRREHGRGGPFLFGAFSPADAMFAPVALRFDTYAVDVSSDESRAYIETIRSLTSVRAFRDDAMLETESLPTFDAKG